eukprot:scaffold79864_cov67-Phaeocystis_antarctica.AAC.2
MSYSRKAAEPVLQCHCTLTIKDESNVSPERRRREGRTRSDLRRSRGGKTRTTHHTHLTQPHTRRLQILSSGSPLGLTNGSALREVVADDERARELCGGEVTLVLQQKAEVIDGEERVRVPTAERFALHLQRLAEQRLSGGEVTLGVQQPAEVGDGGQRARMPIADRLALHLQRLAAQLLSGGEVTLGVQQQAEVVDGAEGVRMPAAERLARHL